MTRFTDYYFWRRQARIRDGIKGLRFLESRQVDRKQTIKGIKTEKGGGWMERESPFLIQSSQVNPVVVHMCKKKVHLHER